MNHAILEQNKLLTAGIAEAYLGANQVLPNDVARLINGIYSAVAGLGEDQQPDAPPTPEPAVSIRASVKPDAVTCMECGFKGKMLKRHLMTTHGLTREAYRARWNMPLNHPLTAPNYSAKRRSISIEVGLGRKS